MGQLPPDVMGTVSLSYLRNELVGINTESIQVGASAKDALRLMQQKGLSSLPVVNENEEWQFFVEREQILSDLISDLLFKQQNGN